MSRKKRTNFSDSLVNLKKTYILYYNRLKELSISMFEWKNLPDTVDVRFLELTLFQTGVAVFFKEDVMGYLALRALLNGSFDHYGIPKKNRAVGVNGYNAELDNKNSVLIYNNYLHTSCEEAIHWYAKRLANLECSIDVNTNAQKTPILVQCDETQRLTMLNLYKEYNGNSPVIFGDKNLNTKGLSVLKTDAPYVADKLYDLKLQIWNEALTYLGISNINVQKKERLITDEVTRNQGGTIASRYSRLQSRREAAEKINEMFELDIEVNYREDFQQIDFGEPVLDVGKDTIGGVGNE